MFSKLFIFYLNLQNKLNKFKNSHYITLCDIHFNRKGSEMIRVLNIAEKNDAAKNIANIMSKGQYKTRNGKSIYNRVYEFNYYLFNQNCHMIMTSVSGHLLNLDFAAPYKKWHACDPLILFEAPIVSVCLENNKKIKATLEEQVKRCHHLIIWTDGDREGENIGFEIVDVCKRVNSRIHIHRARFSEITPRAISQACHNLCEPDERINNAVNVRKELDLRIVTHRKEGILTEFTWKRARLFDHTVCLVLYQKCLEEAEAHVTNINSHSKSKCRPKPLDTVEFEKLASRKLHLNAKTAMTIAEKLYTKGIISYPRTETTIFPKELDLIPLVKLQCEDPNWGDFAKRLIENGPNPRQGNKTDNAHPPIHPIKYSSGLQGNEKLVYELIVRHFLACLSKDAEGREITIEINISEEKFLAKGLAIIARNYLDVYPYEKWNAKVVAEYIINETFYPSSFEMIEGETTPPELLTEADLIALMEKHGIGTDATHAEHIETIKSRLYVGVNERGQFIPGELGIGLIEGYDSMGFQMSKPYLRAELEADLKRICTGTIDPKGVLHNQIVKYKGYFIETIKQAAKIDQALSKYFNVIPSNMSLGHN